ncbi:MAG TPA: hypothetical protein VMV72_07980 [Verrucomicrobiae bacterium]|nr:hypothetical protein [Verrucomicrobiae bacterium]
MPIPNKSVRVTGTWVQRWLGLGMMMCALHAWSPTPASADTVTLKSGEVLEGRVLSETDTQLVIEASFYHGTIFSTREVARSDIQSVVRETPEQKQEKADYEALATFTLNPNQELTTNQYDAGIAMFQTFLTTHTNSPHAAEVTRRLADWRAESSDVASGKVKFAGAWMAPSEKNLQQARATLQSLTQQLAVLQQQRTAQADKLAATQKQLADAQSRLASMSGGSGSAAKQSGRRDLAGRVTAGVVGASQGENTGEPVSSPERTRVEGEINSYQQQVTQQQGVLASLDAKIADIQSQMPTQEQNYQSALAQSSGATPSNNISVAQAPSAKPARASGTNTLARTTRAPAPAPEPPPPWYTRAWKWLHG